MSPPVYRRYTHPWQTKGPLPHPCTLPNFKLGINDLPRHVLPPLHKPGAATPSLLFGVCTHLFFTAPIRSNVSLRIDTPLPPLHPRLLARRPSSETPQLAPLSITPFRLLLKGPSSDPAALLTAWRLPAAEMAAGGKKPAEKPAGPLPPNALTAHPCPPRRWMRRRC